MGIHGRHDTDCSLFLPLCFIVHAAVFDIRLARSFVIIDPTSRHIYLGRLRSRPYIFPNRSKKMGELTLELSPIFTRKVRN
jgi:hypothetical protein